MPSPTFELFEQICGELRLRDECIVTNEFLSTELLQELQDSYSCPTPNVAIETALQFLGRHFRARGSSLPFVYDLNSRRFRVVDQDFINFVSTVSSFRGQFRRGREFEEAMCGRLGMKSTGEVHRVGWPRKQKKARLKLLSHLRTLGFTSRVIYGKEKDGGLDIIWMLPLGAVPRRPLISFQCKNGAFDQAEADRSLGPVMRSFSCHRGLGPNVHTYCLVFNDYIEERMFGRKPSPYVILGLSDFAGLNRPVRTVVL